MEFKGTKGKWTKQQIGNGNIEINATGFSVLATVNFYPEGFREKYINGKLSGSPAPDSLQYRRECLYNALLISKAPEMLSLLSDILVTIDYDEMDAYNKAHYKVELTKLIKEATEL